MALAELADLTPAESFVSFLEVMEEWSNVDEERLASWGFLVWSLWYKGSKAVLNDHLIADHLLVERSGKLKCDYVNFTARVHVNVARRGDSS